MTPPIGNKSGKFVTYQQRNENERSLSAIESEKIPGLTRECDYSLNPTDLFTYIDARNFKAACSLLRGHPSHNRSGVKQANTWVRQLDAEGNIRWRMLPIHAAIMNKAPLELIKRIISYAPLSLKCQENCGKLPLHLAFHKGEDMVIAEVMNGFFGANSVADKEGRLPIECASSMSGNLLATCSEIIEKNNNSAAIDVNDEHRCDDTPTITYLPELVKSDYNEKCAPVLRHNEQEAAPMYEQRDDTSSMDNFTKICSSVSCQLLSLERECSEKYESKSKDNEGKMTSMNTRDGKRVSMMSAQVLKNRSGGKWKLEPGKFSEDNVNMTREEISLPHGDIISLKEPPVKVESLKSNLKETVQEYQEALEKLSIMVDQNKLIPQYEREIVSLNNALNGKFGETEKSYQINDIAEQKNINVAPLDNNVMNKFPNHELDLEILKDAVNLKNKYYLDTKLHKNASADNSVLKTEKAIQRPEESGALQVVLANPSAIEKAYEQILDQNVKRCITFNRMSNEIVALDLEKNNEIPSLKRRIEELTNDLNTKEGDLRSALERVDTTEERLLTCIWENQRHMKKIVLLQKRNNEIQDLKRIIKDLINEWNMKKRDHTLSLAKTSRIETDSQTRANLQVSVRELIERLELAIKSHNAEMRKDIATNAALRENNSALPENIHAGEQKLAASIERIQCLEQHISVLSSIEEMDKLNTQLTKSRNGYQHVLDQTSIKIEGRELA